MKNSTSEPTFESFEKRFSNHSGGKAIVSKICFIIFFYLNTHVIKKTNITFNTSIFDKTNIYNTTVTFKTNTSTDTKLILILILRYLWIHSTSSYIIY